MAELMSLGSHMAMRELEVTTEQLSHGCLAPFDLWSFGLGGPGHFAFCNAACRCLVPFGLGSLGLGGALLLVYFIWLLSMVRLCCTLVSCNLASAASYVRYQALAWDCAYESGVVTRIQCFTLGTCFQASIVSVAG